MDDVKIAIIGRKTDEYLDDSLLSDIWLLLEHAEPNVRRAILYKILYTAHLNGEMQESERQVNRASNVLRNTRTLLEWDKKFGFLTDAPIRPEPTEEDED